MGWPIEKSLPLLHGFEASLGIKNAKLLNRGVFNGVSSKSKTRFLSNPD
jgi:hypothetical protein